MSEPVVQRQAVPDPQEALREALREVLSECRISVHTAPWVQETDDGDVVRLELGRVNAEVLADAVLPVVQAHTQALEDARLIDLHSSCDERWREQRDAARSDLAALRDAVRRLADDFDKDAAGFHGLARHLQDEFIGGKAVTYGTAARRLRSLLGDKENN